MSKLKILSVVLALCFFFPAHSFAAIAFGGATAGAHSANGTSLTYTSVTVSGSNIYGAVCVKTDNASDTITGITWNGVTLSRITTVTRAAGGGRLYCYDGTGVSTGSIVVSANTSSTINAIEDYYTGSSGRDSATVITNSGSASSITTTITPNTTGAWAPLFGDAVDTPGNGINAGTGATKRVANTDDHNLFDNNAAITPPAATSEQVTQTNNESFAIIMWAIDPSIATNSAVSILGLVRSFWLW